MPVLEIFKLFNPRCSLIPNSVKLRSHTFIFKLLPTVHHHITINLYFPISGAYQLPSFPKYPI